MVAIVATESCCCFFRRCYCRCYCVCCCYSFPKKKGKHPLDTPNSCFCCTVLLLLFLLLLVRTAHPAVCFTAYSLVAMVPAFYRTYCSSCGLLCDLQSCCYICFLLFLVRIAHPGVPLTAAGHGEHGDVVSHFVMHDLQSRLAAHPSLAEDPGTALKESYLAVDSSLSKLKVY